MVGLQEAGDWQRPSRQPISPLVGEMSGRTEGGVVEHLPGRGSTAVVATAKSRRQIGKVEDEFRGPRQGRRGSAPLWPAGHLPHEGGDRQLRLYCVSTVCEGRWLKSHLPITV
ncbi:hypothetical protein FJ940_02790 [Mesorhizobium sp. B2-3-7]|nr:hypothetical protein FJ939_01115 [Mesorhizobium sp. B2-3-8]TPM20487.1 hypothetical protein FJ940_02790 [Mesorhizobium sp. B2-3-7]